ncbi:hypothetical protein [Streptomyces sp. bgisy027]|uniref:hypothetical protein n=1 Tax=Streptomyces sp. bgisy027 TaxID=3413770 RepID=UPI003D71E2DC
MTGLRGACPPYGPPPSRELPPEQVSPWFQYAYVFFALLTAVSGTMAAITGLFF